MSQLVFLLEEASMLEVLRIVLPSLLPEGLRFLSVTCSSLISHDESTPS